MKYLERDAAFTYAMLTHLAADNDLVSLKDYIERQLLLRHITDPDSGDVLKAISAWLEDSARIWNKRVDEGYEYIEGGELGAGEADREIGEAKFQGDDFDPTIHFICATAGKVSKWEFHKGDSDGVPSVPHGHAIINHKIKLDPYLGYITKNNKPYGRESRQYIVDLWNDRAFREFATEAIQHYLKTYPHYRWRVPRPYRIPRMR